MKHRFMLLVAVLLAVMTSACNPIPDFYLTVHDIRAQKMRQLGTVYVQKVSIPYTYCSVVEHGFSTYRFLSSETDTSDDYAIWRCADLSFDNRHCPSATITYVNENTIKVSVNGQQEDHHRDEITACVHEFIDLAPTKKRPISDRVANTDSWQEASQAGAIHDTPY